jgi:acetyl esterase/lipase
MVIFVPLIWFLLMGDLHGTQTPLRHETVESIPYREMSGADVATKERCLLNIHYPPGSQDLPVVIWFHGGGLTEGKPLIPAELQKQGLVIVSPGYRLSPQVRSPVYVEDAAAAVTWVMKNIHRYGGNLEKIFLTGVSAGGYLATMVTLDKKYLQAHGLDPDRLAGLISLSGQMITHFTIRQERGISKTQPLVDEMAPLYHIRKDAPPMLVITGDREIEMLGRYEENAYFVRMMKVIGHKDIILNELTGHDHGGMTSPAHGLLLRYVKSRSARPLPGPGK